MISAYYRRVALPGELGALTSSQLAGASPTVLVPVGSTEQHGPHLPLDTDTRIAVAVAREAAARLSCGPQGQREAAARCSASPQGQREAAARCSAGPQGRCLVAPAISYGDSGEHQSFPGTISIGTDALTQLLVEYGRSTCCWARRVVFINGHGGNMAALRSAVGRLRFEARDVCWWACGAEGGDPHAGHTETSVLLHLSPTVVRTDRRRPGNRAPLSDLMPSMRRGGVAAVSEVGVLGDPTTATAAEGEHIFTTMVDGCVRAVSGWAPGADGMLR